MRRSFLLVFLLCLPFSVSGQTPPAGDYTKLAAQADFIARDFRFHNGETLPELRLHHATRGTPRRNAAGEISNAVLLLHGTLGSGINFGAPSPLDPSLNPLLGPGGPFGTEKYYVIAPDTIGSGKSSRPSDGLRMKFPHYNLEDIVAAKRLTIEHLGVTHLIAVFGVSMGGRQSWQWGVLYPDFMDALVPAIASPFPNAGRRGVIDFLPEAIVKADPQWNQGNYQQNPAGARLADLVYSVFLYGPGYFDKQLPTRADSEKWVAEGRGLFKWPDANDFIYQMEPNDGFDAWANLDRIRYPVLMINMSGDLLVPLELRHAEKVVSRLKNASYLEVKEEADYGHLALNRTTTVWGPKLRDWLTQLSRARR